MGVVLAALALVVGVFIGAVGVGGVLLPPGLVAWGDMSAHQATATSTWAFIFTGAVGTTAYALNGAVPWRKLCWLTAGLAPTAFTGALVNARLPGPVVLLGLGCVALAVGVDQLLRCRGGASGVQGGRAPDVQLGATSLVTLGAVVGFGSALTGTGGPVLLVPLLLASGVPPLRAIGLGQAAQLPVVIAGSVGFMQGGLTDVRLGSAMGAIAAVGTFVGFVIATRISGQHLRMAVSWACVTAGVVLIVRVLV